MVTINGLLSIDCWLLLVDYFWDKLSLWSQVLKGRLCLFSALDRTAEHSWFIHGPVLSLSVHYRLTVTCYMYPGRRTACLQPARLISRSWVHRCVSI